MRAVTGGEGPFATRMGRLRAAMGERGVEVALFSVGPELPWLCGYEAMPLERLTMLVVPVDEPAWLVVPELEAPRVVQRSDLFGIEAWSETDDPIQVVARRLRAATKIVVGDRTWARFVVDLQAALPRAAWRRGTQVVGPLRMAKDPFEVDALRAQAPRDR